MKGIRGDDTHLSISSNEKDGGDDAFRECWTATAAFTNEIRKVQEYVSISAFADAFGFLFWSGLDGWTAKDAQPNIFINTLGSCHTFLRKLPIFFTDW